MQYCVMRVSFVLYLREGIVVDQASAKVAYVNIHICLSLCIYSYTYRYIHIYHIYTYIYVRTLLPCPCSGLTLWASLGSITGWPPAPSLC